MKLSQLLTFLIVLLSIETAFSQGTLSIKNYPNTRLIINNDHLNSQNRDVILKYETSNVVLIEIQKDDFISRKSISLSNSLNYEVVETGKGELKLRLRNNLILENPITLLVDTVSLSEPFSNNDLFLKELESSEFEFDKVNLLCSRVRIQEVSNINLSKYLSTLSHDFSKWQVIEIVLDENLIDIDYEEISQTFNSKEYKKRLKTLLSKK